MYDWANISNAVSVAPLKSVSASWGLIFRHDIRISNSIYFIPDDPFSQSEIPRNFTLFLFLFIYLFFFSIS